MLASTVPAISRSASSYISQARLPAEGDLTWLKRSFRNIIGSSAAHRNTSRKVRAHHGQLQFLGGLRVLSDIKFQITHFNDIRRNCHERFI